MLRTGAVCVAKRCTKRVLLVRSQQACIERVARLFVGETIGGYDRRVWPGQSTVIDALILASTVNPLLLHGELLSDRTDAILRLIGLVGCVRRNGSGNVTRLQT